MIRQSPGSAPSRPARMERRITQTGLLVALGLLIQLASHLWTHPLAFMSFLILGTPLVVVGVLMFLLSLIAGADSPGAEADLHDD